MLATTLRSLLIMGFSGCIAACAGVPVRPAPAVAASAPQAAAPPPPLAADVPTAADAEVDATHALTPGQAASDVTPTAAMADAPTDATVENDSRFVDVVTEEGQRARGLYFNGPMAHRLGARGVINMVRGAALNAAVIDIKDGEGRVTYDTQIPELLPERHVFLADAPAFVRTLKEAGVYVIARVVCFSDPVLARTEPDRAVQDGRPGHEGEIWEKNAHRNTWLNPYNEKNHDTIVKLAKDVEAMGFDEIQFDYVRFPVDPATVFAVFPGASEAPRGEVLLGMLRRVDEAIHIPIGVDVFGITALTRGDSTGLLGQSLELWTKHVEVFSPMLYVNGMGEWMRRVTQGRAGLLVQQAVQQLRARVGSGPVIRPFLQAFERGADYYTPEFIAEQIRGSRQGGGDGFLFWHPASNYGMVRAGMLGPARSLMPFPIEARRAFRDEAWGKSPAASPAVAGELPGKPAS